MDYKYDAANRLTERLRDATTNNIEQYTYDGLGRLITARKGTTAASDAVGRSVFAYDALSRVTSEAQAIAGGSAKTVNYTYDKAGPTLDASRTQFAVRRGGRDRFAAGASRASRISRHHPGSKCDPGGRGTRRPAVRRKNVMRASRPCRHAPRPVRSSARLIPARPRRAKTRPASSD